MGSSAKKAPLLALGLVLVVALLATVPVALAAEGEGEGEITRSEYKARVEPICKKNTDANSRILKGVKEQVVKRNELVPAGKRFIKASSVFGETVKKISAVPQPAADEAKLTTWIGYLDKEQGFLLSIGKALKSESKGRAEKLATKLTSNTNKAKNTVISFGFKECKLEQSRYL